jgi:hypothetical protein
MEFNMTTENRRKKISKPKVFNEKRESMLLIESASTTDMYLWCISILFMFSFIAGMLIYALN